MGVSVVKIPVPLYALKDIRYVLNESLQSPGPHVDKVPSTIDYINKLIDEARKLQ
jgi:hypothetical protein